MAPLAGVCRSRADAMLRISNIKQLQSRRTKADIFPNYHYNNNDNNNKQHLSSYYRCLIISLLSLCQFSRYSNRINVVDTSWTELLSRCEERFRKYGENLIYAPK